MAAADSAGQLVDQGHALRALAELTSIRGNPDAAATLYDRAQAAFERAGALADVAGLFYQRGNDAYRRSSHDEVERDWLAALAHYEVLGNLERQASQLRQSDVSPSPLD